MPGCREVSNYTDNILTCDEMGSSSNRKRDKVVKSKIAQNSTDILKVRTDHYKLNRYFTLCWGTQILLNKAT